jgi:hypothetical protein
MVTRIRDILTDDAMDAYDEWRHESEEVESAYRRWSTAPPTDAALAFAAYVAALDREDQASIWFAQIVRYGVAVCEDDFGQGSWLPDAA